MSFWNHICLSLWVSPMVEIVHGRKMRCCLYQTTVSFSSSPLMNMTILYWPEFNSARFLWAVVLYLWLMDTGLQETVGSSWYGWADLCLQRREGWTEWCSPCYQKPYMCLAGFLWLQRAQQKSARKKMVILEGRKLQVRAEAALLGYATRVFWTVLAAATVGEGPSALCTAAEYSPLRKLCMGFERRLLTVNSHNFSVCTWWVFLVKTLSRSPQKYSLI